jgi:hypothetical protein
MDRATFKYIRFLTFFYPALRLNRLCYGAGQEGRDFLPLPPDPPRISYVSSFSEPKDLGVQNLFSKGGRVFIR